MSTAVRTNFFRETMPQTVPSAGYNSPFCDYSAFTTDFDLSLLPASPESEVPLSPKNLSPYSYLYPSSPPMFSANLEDGILCDNLGFVNLKAKITSDIKPESEDEPLRTPLKKSPSSGFFQEKDKDDKFEFFVKKEEKTSKPLIPTTVQATTSGYYPLSIKQEPSSFGVDYPNLDYQTDPPSPYAIKSEKTIDLQEAVKEVQFLNSPPVSYGEGEEKQYATLRSLLKTPAANGTKPEEAKPDHQLLRSVLKDTSFQKRFNIRAFDLPESQGLKMQNEGGRESDGGGGGSEMEELTSEKMEPVFSLAIEQIKRDVDNTCSILGISSDPAQWTEEDVKAWLLWTVRQFSLPMINTDCFNMNGASLCQLTEEDFQRRAPQSCSTLHAHLEIWKAAASCCECSATPSQDLSTVQWSPTMHSSGSSTGGDLSEDEDEEMELGSPQSKPSTSQLGEPSTSTAGGKGRGSSGSHIHLWQFLKELLASPQVHGSCIRWLDRQKGVFKIEDSVRVARLWGKRKNRPAMNYDKLSRSIRQYYKKGIMKKTERSQRLVYQFCHPYCL